MAKRVKSFAVPSMLKWGRLTAGLKIEDVASTLRIDPVVLEKWENDDGSPSFAQLRKLAAKYRRPISAFYLPAPPRDFTVVRDFRAFPEALEGELTPELRFLIRSTRGRQEWLAEFLLSTASEDRPSLPKVQSTQHPVEVARRLRSFLSVTVEDQFTTPSIDAAFAFWRERCEQRSICVFIGRNVALQEMRGIALVDDIVPAIVINAKDSPSGKIFTLAHELAHLALGEEGISDQRINPESKNPNQVIEVFCNAVAGEMLVPRESLNPQYASLLNDFVDVDDAITTLAGRYRVSREVIGRRLLDLGHITQPFYEARRAIWNTPPAPRPKSQKPVKIARAVLVLHTTGRRFARAAVSAFHDGLIPGNELTSLLGMSLKHLQKLENKLETAILQD